MKEKEKRFLYTSLYTPYNEPQAEEKKKYIWSAHSSTHTYDEQHTFIIRKMNE